MDLVIVMFHLGCVEDSVIASYCESAQGLPPGNDPSLSVRPGGIQASDGQVEALQGCSLVREGSTCADARLNLACIDAMALVLVTTVRISTSNLVAKRVLAPIPTPKTSRWPGTHVSQFGVLGEERLEAE